MAVRKRQQRRARPAVEAPAKIEPPGLQKARLRIRKLVERTTDGKEKHAVGLVLALVNQETGNHRAANQIIDEFKLDKRFGIQKFER